MTDLGRTNCVIINKTDNEWLEIENCEVLE